MNDITADYPMFIRKFDDSQFAVNKAAFRALKLDLNNPQAPDVEFLRDSKGQINGHMRGKGVIASLQYVRPAQLFARAAHAANKERARRDSQIRRDERQRYV